MWTAEQRIKYALSKEEQTEYHKKYRQIHKKQRNEYNKTWRKKHLEEDKKYFKEYRKNYPEQCKNRIRNWYLEHPEQVKINRRIQRSKRRDLGFIPLNESFNDSVAHHIDKIHVVYIPKQLHISVSHNIWTGKGITEINDKVFKWLLS